MKTVCYFSRRKVALLFTMLIVGLLALTPRTASAHPLGNFTTNTATSIVVARQSLDLLYVLDLAEIPALKVRQELDAVTGAVPDSIANAWRDSQCTTLGNGLSLQRDGVPLVLVRGAARIVFPLGQAGLTTLRLECNFGARFAPDKNSGKGSAKIRFDFADANFPDRVGWREIVAKGDSVGLVGSVASESPSKLLTLYPTGALSSPLHQRDASFTSDSSIATSPQLAAVPSTSDTSSAPASSARGNDGLTKRFQSLVARRNITFPFALGAILLAIGLGALHAMAPGHGKTIMAAYAVSRRGSTGDILSIGATVALTHTVGIILLGALVSATSVVSPDRTLRWASVFSGVLVIAVGVTLVRGRVRAAMRARRSEAAHDHAGHDHSDSKHTDHHHDHAAHDHAAHDHAAHDHAAHDHAAHAHDHAHGHGHPHAPAHGVNGGSDAVTTAHPTNDRFIVTSHSHGGWSHDHVLPAPGAFVRRRELIAMGLAGGLVPSPSALVVLLAAIALGRVPFGVGLVMAYGVGLAGALIGAGLLLVRFESRLRRWTSNRNTPMGSRFVVVMNALPIVSGLAIVGAGCLLVARSVSKL